MGKRQLRGNCGILLYNNTTGLHGDKYLEICCALFNAKCYKALTLATETKRTKQTILGNSDFEPAGTNKSPTRSHIKSAPQSILFFFLFGADSKSNLAQVYSTKSCNIRGSGISGNVDEVKSITKGETWTVA